MPTENMEQPNGIGILLALEPRIMFDGAALLTGAETAQDQASQDQPTPEIEGGTESEGPANALIDNIDLFSALSSVSALSEQREIVFIDTSVDDYLTLLEGIDPGAETILLDSSRDGIEQMAEILRDRSGIDAIHIISHGNQGELQLGTGKLNEASMQGAYADELAIINQALTEEADVLIYGCNFGEGQIGHRAASLLGELTGADIAASNDVTGTESLGGNWNLEINTGTIETSVAISAHAQEHWQGLLATLTPTDEFTVNTTPGNDEETSGFLRGAERAVDIAPNGDYVVVWTDATPNDDIFAKVLDRDGNEKIAQFQVNSSGANNAGADVAMDDNGNFVVTWTQTNDIAMRRFNANGTAVDGADVIVNTTVSNIQQNASININGTGDFVIAWENDGGSNEGIFVRQGSFSGGLTGSDITVDSTATTKDPSVGIADSGDFVVAYDDGAGDVLFQQIDSSGTLQASGQVNGALQLNAARAAVDMAGNGRFTVAYTATGLGLGVHARQFDATGTSLFLPTVVNTSFANDQTNPSISMADNNEFIVVWEGDGNQTGQVDADGVFGQKFDAGGSKIDSEFLINQTTANNQDRASVAMLDLNNFVVAWTGSDGTQTDVFARQYGVPIAPTLDLDANDSSGATGNNYAFTFTEGNSAMAIADSDTDLVDTDSTTFTSVNLTITGLQDGNAETLVLDGDSFALATAVAGQDTFGSNYHVVITTNNGTATVAITKQGGGTFTEAEIETLITAIQYQHTDTNTPTDGNRLIDVTVNDGGLDSAAARTTINVNSVNDPPTFTGLDHLPLFTEGGGAVVLDNNVTVADPELDAANSYNGATLTLVRNGGANGEDLFEGRGTLSSLIEGGNVVQNGTTIGTVTTNSGGTLILTFNGNATTTLVNDALQKITYANSSPTPPGNVQINFTINDGNMGSQGSGGPLNDTGSITVTINGINNAPTVDLDLNDSSGATGNNYQFLFTEGDSLTTIADIDTDLVDLDSGAFASVTLVANGLLDGNAEVLALDGDIFALGTAVTGQDTSGGNYHVVLTTGAGTASMTITKQGGGLFTEIQTETLIKAIQYQHTDTSTPTDGDRLIDVIVNDGTIDSTPARTTITVNEINTLPVAVADSFTINEGSTTILNLAGNDSDIDDGLDLTSITIISGPTNGSIDSINAGGTVTYTHNGSETLTDSFTYTIKDLAGATSNTVTVSLTITPQNDDPTITSNGGGASAAITVLVGNTTITNVSAIDPEGAPLTYSITGGADAAQFNIDSTTGALTFTTAPNLQAPADVDANNVYDVIVQASDGTLIDTQSISVTVIDLPIVVLPPPPDPPSPESPPPPDEGDGNEEETSIGGNLLPQTKHFSSGGTGQSSTSADPNNADSLKKATGNELAMLKLGKKNTGSESTMDTLMSFLRRPFGDLNFKNDIQALLGRSSGFLKDLDRARDSLNEITATEHSYVVSSIAVSTGLSVGYVIWLLRSGVLLTALLSSVPAWQFVNPLLVLDAPAKKKKRKNGEGETEDDSLETMFDAQQASAKTTETTQPKPRQSRWTRRTSP